MGDNSEQLVEYRLQLQQVDAALTNDPSNEELTKLKSDLEEVIQLTEDLIASQDVDLADDLTEEASASELLLQNSTSLHGPWKIGDPCMAIWSVDKEYHPAVIDEVQDDGQCTVTFDVWNNTEVTQMTSLQNRNEHHNRSTDGQGSSKPMSKKDKMTAEREYKRKKNQKKAQRLKDLDEEREKEKNKWLSFNAKTFSKSNKGKVKKSIFATPDSYKGRTGVGTCNSSGRTMTSYTKQEKWKKN